jgi:hypothetical protein
MDTDNLSNEAYNAVLVESEKLTHDLTIHFGVIAKKCKDERAYLDKAFNLTINILKLTENQLQDFFWGTVPDKNKLILTLNKIISNIIEVNEIPPDRLTYD